MLNELDFSFTHKIHLGVPEKERRKKQKIVVQIKLRKKIALNTYQDDDINCTVCYDELYKKLVEFYDNKQFKLLEYLSEKTYYFLKKHLPHHYQIWVQVCKNPPIKHVQMAAFQIGDFHV
ncbi:MAG: hypothetical protein COB50_04845 [Thiotrichales bacterium]|nr:MAG: hypothetical protein COB50_04845 [Thiotrichales bacterium]